MTLLEAVRRRFARPPDAVRAAVEDEDERVLAWGRMTRDEGWLVATSRGLRVLGPGEARSLLPWHEVGSARWAGTADGGGSFVVVPLVEVEPGVQARVPARQYALADAGDLPSVVRKRVDQTIVASQRFPLAGGGGVVLVARRLPGQAVKEWTVVFDDDTDRSDPAMREQARRRLADALAAEQPD